MTLTELEKVWAMPLCDIPLEPSYKNPIYFDEKGKLNDGTYLSPSRATFFEKYDSNFDTGGTGYQEVNFQLGDTIRTSLTMEVTDTSKLNANYLHIIWSKVNEATSTRKLPNQLFYFVKGVNQVTGNVYKYDLELDVITTFSPYLQIRGNKPLMTERKHCNRWGDYFTADNTIYLPLKTGQGADAVIGDEIDGRFRAEIPIYTEKITLEYEPIKMIGVNPVVTIYNPNLGSTLDVRKVKSWLYVFVLRNNNTRETIIEYDTSKKLHLPYDTFVAPLTFEDGYNTSYTRAVVEVNGAYYQNQVSARKLYNTFVDEPDLVSIRVSNVNPYADGNQFVYEDINQHLTLGYPDNTYAIIKGVGGEAQHDGDCFLKVNYLSYNGANEEPQKATIDNDLPVFVYSNYVLGNLRNPYGVFEPKLYTSPFRRFGIKLQGSDIKDYDKLLSYDDGVSDLSITKQGLVTPDSQKVFYTIDSGVYKDLYKSNIGLTFNPAYNLPMINDTYKTFLATQSNQQLQSVVMGTIGSVAQIGLGIATAGVASSAGAVVKGVGGVSSGVLGGINAITSYYAKREDMRNAPDAVSKMGQNVLTDTFSGNDEELYVVEYGLTSVETKMVDDYFYENGYKVLRDCYFSWDDNIDKNDFIITRTLFNFVKLNDEAFINNVYAEEIVAGRVYNYSLSTMQRRTLGEIFANGVCLWTLYGITTGNDIDKYYLSKEYENMELGKLFNIVSTPEQFKVFIANMPAVLMNHEEVEVVLNNQQIAVIDLGTITQTPFQALNNIANYLDDLPTFTSNWTTSVEANVTVEGYAGTYAMLTITAKDVGAKATNIYYCDFEFTGNNPFGDSNTGQLLIKGFTAPS